MPTGITLKERFCKGCDNPIGQAPAQKWCSPQCRRQNYVWDSSNDKCIKCGIDFKLNQTSYCLKCTVYSRHNLTRDDVEFLKLSQGGRCSICNDLLTDQFQIDHDHRCCKSTDSKSCGKCVRGLLCRACNHALGRFKDQPYILRNAVNYIERNL